MSLSSSITPEKIIFDLKNKNISKTKAEEFLISLIETSDNAKIRIQCIRIIRELDSKSDNVFKILESSLVSDENSLVRSASAKLILISFPKIGLAALKWVIHNEKSIRVITSIKNHLRSEDNEYNRHLLKELSNSLAGIYGVIPDESLFLIDLENSKDKNLEIGFYKPHIERNRIKSLELAGWKIKKLPSSIGSLTELNHLNLWDNSLISLPRSIEKLQKLKYLYLDWNKFTKFPDLDWKKLKNLEKLSLTNNYNIEDIPKSLFLLIKQNISKKYINEGANLNDASTLGVIEVLTGQKLEKIHITEKINKLYACNYRLNKNGHIVGIYLYGYHSFQINIIPKQIFFLKYLEELTLREQNIKVIPESIEKLKFLKKIDLMNNKIEEIPRSINALDKLEFLDLEGNLIANKPELRRSSEIDLWL